MNLDRRLLHEASGLKTHFALTIVCGLVAGMLLVVQAYTFSRIVNRAFLHGQSLDELAPMLVALLAVALLRALLLWAKEVAAYHTAGIIKIRLRERLFAHLIALGPVYARGERSGELTHTLVEGIEELEAYFSQYLPQLALSAGIPLVMLLLVFPIDPLSGLVLMVTAPLIPFFMILIGKWANTQSQKQWRALSLMSAHFLDVLQGLTTLKMFGRSRDQTQTIHQVSEHFRDTTMSVLRIAFLSALTLELLSTLSTAVVAVQIGLRLLYAKIGFEEAFFVLILTPEFYLPLRQLGTRFHAGISGYTAAQRIFSVLETPLSDYIVSPVAEPADISLRKPSWRIQFNSLHYMYAQSSDDSARVALQDVSFMLRSHHKTALVGPSGSGKTTITQLLLRFIEAPERQIMVDDVPLCKIPVEAWREDVAWVPQFPYLFQASIADNIRLTRPDAPMDEVVRAAQVAHVDTFIDQLPNGYDTLIGERGARLSGGQAQRIALARAVFKDAPLLILDEATANLDPETELRVQDALRTLMQNRTVLIIAHRLNTVMDADHIVVLNQGRVVEQGTHNALIDQHGLYHRMITHCMVTVNPPAKNNRMSQA